MRKIEMIVERTKTGFCAYAAKYAVYTTGNDFMELKANILEALNLYFDDESKTIAENSIKFCPTDNEY